MHGERSFRIFSRLHERTRVNPWRSSRNSYENVPELNRRRPLKRAFQPKKISEKKVYIRVESLGSTDCLASTFDEEQDR